MTAEIDYYPNLTDATVAAAPLLDVAVHFLGFRQIRMKDGKVGPPPKINRLQRELFDAYKYMQFHGLPISIIILKARQLGASEGVGELVYHHGRRFNLGGFMMADKDEHTTNIWTLFTKCATSDLYAGMWPNTFKSDTEKASILYKDPNGKAQAAAWNRGTAGASTTGASGTRQIAWFSESARYSRKGACIDTDVIGNVLNSIPDNLPNSLRIAESTAEGGAGGWHHDTFKHAVTLAELRAGKRGNGWVKIFVGWHQAEDYRTERGPGLGEYFDDEDDRWTAFREDEQAGTMRYGWTPEQIAWRRKKIIGDLGGKVELFKRDYPSSPEEAWAASGTKRFNVVAVARMLRAAEAEWEATVRQQPQAARLGSLQNGATGPVFMATREESWLWVKEEPKFSCKYLISVDPMTGEQSAGSTERDAHSVLVLRDAYRDDKGGIFGAAVVAAIHVPGGCQWDIDVLAERLIRVWKWYGKPTLVPETNVALDLIPPLVAAGVNLYKRDARPDDLNPSMKRHIVGFKTTTTTKRLWVSAAAEAIRESGVECLYLPAVQQFDCFVEGANGTCAAAAGEHDDHCASFGIGCLTLGAATPYTPPTPVPNVTGWTSRQPSAFAQRGSGAFA